MPAQTYPETAADPVVTRPASVGDTPHGALHPAHAPPPPMIGFVLCNSLIYALPVLYALLRNGSLLADFTSLFAGFVVAHAVLYILWHASAQANLAGNKVQLLFYQLSAFSFVGLIALSRDMFWPAAAGVDDLFFGLVGLPVLYAGLAVVNYAFFVWILRIL